jgi:hypothetical protein
MGGCVLRGHHRFFIFKMSDMVKKACIMATVLVSMTVVLSVPPGEQLLRRVWLARFEQRVFQLAPVNQWRSLIPLAVNTSSTNGFIIPHNNLPPFARQLYEDFSFGALDGDPISNDQLTNIRLQMTNFTVQIYSRGDPDSALIITDGSKPKGFGNGENYPTSVKGIFIHIGGGF